MEAQVGAEGRRLHIVYFLSRKSHIDHPHLIKVNHLSINGVRLRDIKRWLGELRGKDIADSFSWSYKRKYKSGYVWQDLMDDDDLITPISDNEYVLKGSEISSKSNTINKASTKTSFKEENYQCHSSDTSIMYVSTKSSSEIQEESPTFGSESSTLTDDSTKLETENNSETTKHQNQQEKPPYNEKIAISYKAKTNEKTISIPVAATAASSSEPRFTKTVFRNLITCGSADTNDSAVFKINKRNRGRPFLNMCSNDEKIVREPTEVCKRDRTESSLQQLNGRKNFQQEKDSIKNKNECKDQRVHCSAAYKPIKGPNCSQCGKQFKPEKLHAHLKSCKGIKAMAKFAANNPEIATATHEKTKKSLTKSQNIDSVSGYLRTH
ncbi:hypothetical protein ACJIZ3_016437 [Penstemon smallii]|uniref:SOSEKI DIX-like domain-containing protein n=1 Tax=Penstemon smallii TaxID=265156 RepID=A0ABD3RQE9_9LAMI